MYIILLLNIYSLLTITLVQLNEYILLITDLHSLI